VGGTEDACVGLSYHRSKIYRTRHRPLCAAAISPRYGFLSSLCHRGLARVCLGGLCWLADNEAFELHTAGMGGVQETRVLTELRLYRL
jgi:hypothetical protein